MERKILGALVSSREAYESLEGLVSDFDFGDLGKIIYSQISEYYESDPDSQFVDRDILLSSLQRKYERHADRLANVVSGLEEVSVPNVVKEFLELKKHNVGTELSQLLMTNGSQQKIQSLIEQYQRFSAGELPNDDEKSEVCNDVSPALLVNSLSGDGLIRLYPKSLNDRVEGGVPPGTHIVFFGTPEAGKSMVSINLASGFCKDNRRVMYWGNEDPKDNMLVRFISRMSGMPKVDVLKNPNTAYDKACEKGYRNLFFVSSPAGTIRDIREKLDEIKPDVLIIDQIRQLHVPGVDGEVEQLTRVSKAARSIAKEYGIVVVSVTQGADSASNKLVLDQGDVYMSNTSVPGDADLLIGIGVTKQAEQHGMRMLSICKNKISGNHDAFEVFVNPQLSKVTSR